MTKYFFIMFCVAFTAFIMFSFGEDITNIHATLYASLLFAGITAIAYYCETVNPSRE